MSIITNEQAAIFTSINKQIADSNKSKSDTGYCNTCKVYMQCPWLCTKEKDSNNSPIDACFSKEV